MRAHALGLRLVVGAAGATGSAPPGSPPVDAPAPSPPYVEAPASTRAPSLESLVFARVAPSLAAVITHRQGSLGGDALGTAFVVHPSGLLLTSHHVVRDAHAIRLRFADGSTVPARVAGADPAIDLAVLRVLPPGPESGPEPGPRPKVLRAAPLGKSEPVAPGDPVLVLAMGLGLQPTITRGIVSGKDRRLDLTAFGAAGIRSGFLQTDAPLEPGSSGGPLTDLDGAVIGVTTAMSPTSRSAGFALPIDVAKRAIVEILRRGAAGRAWLGLVLGPATAAGCEVLSVRPGGPADRAGLRSGDVVQTLRGRSIASDDDLTAAVRDLAVHETLSITYLRRGTVTRTRLTAEEVPAPSPDESRVSLGGAWLAEVPHGVRFVEVPSGSRAEKAGVRTGDVLVVLGIDYVGNLDDVRILLDRRDDRDGVHLFLWRNDHGVSVVVPLDPSDPAP